MPRSPGVQGFRASPSARPCAIPDSPGGSTRGEVRSVLQIRGPGYCAALADKSGGGRKRKKSSCDWDAEGWDPILRISGEEGARCSPTS